MAPGHATVGTVNVPDLIDTDDEGEDDDCVNNSVDALIDSSSDKCNMSDEAFELLSCLKVEYSNPQIAATSNKFLPRRMQGCPSLLSEMNWHRVHFQ